MPSCTVRPPRAPTGVALGSGEGRGPRIGQDPGLAQHRLGPSVSISRTANTARLPTTDRMGPRHCRPPHYSQDGTPTLLASPLQSRQDPDTAGLPTTARLGPGHCQPPHYSQARTPTLLGSPLCQAGMLILVVSVLQPGRDLEAARGDSFRQGGGRRSWFGAQN